MAAPGREHRATVREKKDSMNKFVFVALMTWSGLTAAAGFAPGSAAGREGPAYASQSPVVSWTCTHNAYRSVLCP